MDRDVDHLWVDQYVSCQVRGQGGLAARQRSALPWDGKVTLVLFPQVPTTFTVHLRIPSWSDRVRRWVQGEPVTVDLPSAGSRKRLQTACGYDPYASTYSPVRRSWSPGDVIELEVEMGIRARATHPTVRATRGPVAVTRGPLVYCLESVDNPGVDLFAARLDPAKLRAAFRADHLGGITVVRAQTVEGQPLILIPYFLWADRGQSAMTVYVDAVRRERAQFVRGSVSRRALGEFALWDIA